MKFLQYYTLNQIPEWTLAYINYEFLVRILNPFKKVAQRIEAKDLILRIIKQQSLTMDMPDQVLNKIMLLEEEFVTLYQDELKKCDKFYEIQIEILNQQLSSILYKDGLALKHDLEILYKKGQYLKQYRELNFQAAQKLIRKYSQHTSYLDNSAKYLQEILQLTQFYSDNSLKKILNNIKQLIKEGEWDIKDLKQHKLNINQQQSRIFEGIYIGTASFLFLCFLYQRVNMIFISELQNHLLNISITAQGLIILYLLLFLISIKIFNLYLINYQEILQTQYIQSTLIRVIPFLTMLYLIIVNIVFSEEQQEYANNHNLQYYNSFGQILIVSPTIWSYILWGIMGIILLMPINIWGYDSRKYFIKLQIQTILLYSQDSRLVWNCEQWLSFTLFINLLYTTQFINIGQLIITSIPIIYRIIYSFKHKESLPQLLKYIFLQLFFILSYFIHQYVNNIEQKDAILYPFLGVMSIYYSICDYIYDWQQRNHRIQAYNTYFYYIAAIQNTLLIFCWLYTISIDVTKDHILYLLASLEIYRRFIWNLIYFEKEHIKIQGDFYAVPEIETTQRASLEQKKQELFNQLELKKAIDSQVREKANSLQALIEELENSQIKQGLLDQNNKY